MLPSGYPTMTFRRSLAAALFVGCSVVLGCAALPASNGCYIADCAMQGDASIPDGYTQPGIDGGGSGDVGTPTSNARLSLCGSQLPCMPDDTTDLCNATDAGLSDAALLACHVVLGSGQKTSEMCLAAGTGEDGASCTSGLDCASGFECVGNGTCRHYCCDDAVCTQMTKASTNNTAYFCDVAPEKAASGAKVPVCFQVSPCQPLATDQCYAGQTCTVVEVDNSTRLVATCDTMGTGVLGDSCETEQCADGFACIGATGQRTCQQMCDPQHPCSGSLNCNTKSQALNSLGVGVCGP